MPAVFYALLKPMSSHSTDFRIGADRKKLSATETHGQFSVRDNDILGAPESEVQLEKARHEVIMAYQEWQAKHTLTI